MNERTRQGLHIIEAALLLGVLGDALLRATPWGLNFFLWMGACIAAACALLKHGRRAALRGAGAWLISVALLFAAAFAWRDSPVLKCLDALACMCAAGLLAWRAAGAALKLAGLTNYALGLAHAAAQTIFGSLLLVFADVRWRDVPRNGWTRHVLAVVRGLLIAVPLLIIFGALFMAADAVFEGLVNRTFKLDGETLATHGFLFTFFAWLTAGYFRGLLFGGAQATGTTPAPAPHVAHTAAHEYRAQPASVTAEASETDADSNATSKGAHDARGAQTTDSTRGSAQPGLRDYLRVDLGQRLLARAPRFALGAVEVGVVLGLLDALFLGFVCVQVRYLFGGAAWVAQTGGLTYAEYARRGFFELVWATALVLPLLLALHWLLRTDDAKAQRLFRALAAAQIALLFVVIASALTRMRLYQREYGLTELRLYTTAFMGWLALVFVWFAATVLRGARLRFACGALVTAALVSAALHLCNPDDMIVRTNLAHARHARSFDARYATSLSADAVPTLVAALPALAQAERCLAARELLARWSAQGPEGWRTWSIARRAAWRAIAQQEETLRAWACARPGETSAPAVEMQRAPEAPTTPATQSVPTLPDANTTMVMASVAPSGTSSARLKSKKEMRRGGARW